MAKNKGAQKNKRVSGGSLGHVSKGAAYPRAPGHTPMLPRRVKSMKGKFPVFNPK